MRISVVGATGMVGSRLVAESARRGHEVTAVSRSGASVEGASSATAMDLGETAKLVALINASDATVIAIPPDRTGGSHEPLLQAHRNLIAAGPTGRFLIVGGAGALEVDGIQLKDRPGFPPVVLPEATTLSTVLDLYRASASLNWTMLAPAPSIAPGERSGRYRVGADSPAGSSISAEDFAVAIVDELVKPAHAGTRFTVAN